MTAREMTVWGIRAGKTGDAENLFLKKNHLGLGWPAMRDVLLKGQEG